MRDEGGVDKRLSGGDWALLIVGALVFGFIALAAAHGGMISGDFG